MPEIPADEEAPVHGLPIRDQHRYAIEVQSALPVFAEDQIRVGKHVYHGEPVLLETYSLDQEQRAVAVKSKLTKKQNAADDETSLDHSQSNLLLTGVKKARSRDKIKREPQENNSALESDQRPENSR